MTGIQARDLKSRRIGILAIGQSNIANHGEPVSASRHGRVFHAGAFHPVADPVPGGSGDGGSIWPRLCDRMAETDDAAELLLVLLAQGGTSIEDWASGKCRTLLDQRLPEIGQVASQLTHVVFHQGERDTLLGTGTADYLRHFDALHSAVDRHLPGLTWIICTATYRFGETSAQVREAQQQIPQLYANCASGPDTDRLESDKRHDDTHFNADGLTEFAELLADRLSAST